jgi:hypothetical protein
VDELKTGKYYVTSRVRNGVTEHFIMRNIEVDGKRKTENYPKKNYKGYSQEEVERLVVQLNYSAEMEAKKLFEYRHAFIDSKMLQDYPSKHCHI